MDFHKVALQQELAHGGYQLGLRLEDQGVAVAAQIDPTIVQAAVDGRVLADGQGLGDGFDLHRIGQDFHAAQLYIAVFNGHAFGGDNGFHRQLIDDGGDLGVLFLFDGQLHAAGIVAQHQEGHGALIADVLHKALYFVALAQLQVGNQASFHIDSLPFGSD